MAKDENQTATQQSARDKIIALQMEMQADQLAVAKELVDAIAGAESAAFIEKLQALRDRAIPGQQIDQQIAQLIGVIAHVGQFGAQTYQQLMQQQA